MGVSGGRDAAPARSLLAIAQPVRVGPYSGAQHALSALLDGGDVGSRAVLGGEASGCAVLRRGGWDLWPRGKTICSCSPGAPVRSFGGNRRLQLLLLARVYELPDRAPADPSLSGVDGGGTAGCRVGLRLQRDPVLLSRVDVRGLRPDRTCARVGASGSLEDLRVSAAKYRATGLLPAAARTQDLRRRAHPLRQPGNACGLQGLYAAETGALP